MAKNEKKVTSTTSEIAPNCFDEVAAVIRSEFNKGEQIRSWYSLRVKVFCIKLPRTLIYILN